ncbi:IS3 family transposase [Spiroplasma gladiatoris]|uniref:IS3 family transposase n=1 Tax=Spiroplasma gladiatoris TaxID=2143 RepID=A0A4P7AJV8_9MOLU|nr:DDE-type integrase/transposase/recombinase [Spiroplasma gladiatoris]QBQ07840.1 IS3 family transposase [Spiroplasma gladiatoris]
MTIRDTSYDLFINQVFYDKYSKYGTHRKWGHKKNALKFGLGRKMVLSSMKTQNLVTENCEKSRKWKAYTKKSKDPINTAPNLLKNQETNKIEFIANKMLEKIFLDISECKIKNKKNYLFAYIDIYSRLPLITYFANNQTNEELINSMKLLVDEYDVKNSIIQMDRGSQFRSLIMKEFCNNYNIIQSMTDGYASWQNSIVETFFKSIKQNHYVGYKFEDNGTFINWMKDYIWNYSNNRIINKLKNTPKEIFESNLLKYM